VRMIKPRSSSILTTGMFNLIVKDPRRLPPKRAAWIESATLSLHVLELAALHFCAHFPFLPKSQGLVKQNRFSLRFSCFSRLGAPAGSNHG
jgi:hypothetical protein